MRRAEESTSTLPLRLKWAASLVGGTRELSRLTGIPARTISNHAAARNEPRVSDLVKIARATGLSVEWLATGETPGDPRRRATREELPPELIAPLARMQERADQLQRRARPRIRFNMVVLAAALAAVMTVSLWQIGRALLAVAGWLP